MDRLGAGEGIKADQEKDCVTAIDQNKEAARALSRSSEKKREGLIHRVLEMRQSIYLDLRELCQRAIRCKDNERELQFILGRMAAERTVYDFFRVDEDRFICQLKEENERPHAGKANIERVINDGLQEVTKHLRDKVQKLEQDLSLERKTHEADLSINEELRRVNEQLRAEVRTLRTDEKLLEYSKQKVESEIFQLRKAIDDYNFEIMRLQKEHREEIEQRNAEIVRLSRAWGVLQTEKAAIERQNQSRGDYIQQFRDAVISSLSEIGSVDRNEFNRRLENLRLIARKDPA